MHKRCFVLMETFNFIEDLSCCGLQMQCSAVLSVPYFRLPVSTYDHNLSENVALCFGFSPSVSAELLHCIPEHVSAILLRVRILFQAFYD